MLQLILCMCIVDRDVRAMKVFIHFAEVEVRNYQVYMELVVQIVPNRLLICRHLFPYI